MITSKELADMRRAAGLTLPNSCTIQTRTRVSDSQGGETETWASTTGIPCKLNPITVRNQSSEGDQFHIHAGWVLTVRHDQAIVSGSRVVFDSDTYEVLSVEDDHSWRLFRRAYLRRID